MCFDSREVVGTWNSTATSNWVSECCIILKIVKLTGFFYWLSDEVFIVYMANS